MVARVRLRGSAVLASPMLNRGTAFTLAERQALGLSAARAAGTPMWDQTVVIHGAGTAGIVIADALRQAMIDDGLSPAEAVGRFYALDSKGLLTSDYPGTMRDFQVRYARPAAEVANWRRDVGGGIGLAEVVTRARPTMLIGTSTQRCTRSAAACTCSPPRTPGRNWAQARTTPVRPD